MTIAKLRLFNFGYFSVFAMFLSFLPVYLAAGGLPESQIGLILAAGGIVGVFAQPFWGLVSDRARTIKKVLLPIFAFSLALGFVLFQTSSALAVGLLVGAMYFLFMPTDPLVESLNAQTALRKNFPYGSIRMFGALGYASASLLVGVVANHAGIQSLGYLFLGYGIATLLIGFATEDVSPSVTPLHINDMKKFLGRKETLSFFLLVFVLALPHRMNDIFIGMYIGELGGDLRTVGYAWSLMTAAEVAFFAFAHRLTKPGMELGTIAVAGALYVLRFALSAVVDSPAAVAALQLMQGVTFVLFYTSAIQYLYAIVPEPWRATGQTMLAVLFFGFSGILGSFFGGMVLERFGGDVLYGVMAALSAAGAILCLLLRRRAGKAGGARARG
ncbi:MFS transporter [Paenibacillus sp.]|uniref:MFS transporter n=1 Tax=Paenibacillus sp. TaxID=58172 RepID=UPI002D51CCFD|nr:MFS transporter [Paenibacillus sp.]HZG57952.1 MFS transporter [Paenibacillus sp.]